MTRDFLPDFRRNLIFAFLTLSVLSELKRQFIIFVQMKIIMKQTTMENLPNTSKQFTAGKLTNDS